MNTGNLPQIESLPIGKSLVMFDGYCNLCNGAVQFILKRDENEHFYFAALSWPVAQKLIDVNPTFVDKDSIIVFHKGKLYSESSAALFIAKRLRRLWPLTGIFWIIPKFIRDALYRWVAKNRYKWFGRKDSCMIPDRDMTHRFLD